MKNELADELRRIRAEAKDACVAKVAEEQEWLPDAVLTDPVVENTYLGILVGYGECRQLVAKLRAGEASPLSRNDLGSLVAKRIEAEFAELQGATLSPRASVLHRVLGGGRFKALQGRCGRAR